MSEILLKVNKEQYEQIAQLLGSETAQNSIVDVSERKRRKGSYEANKRKQDEMKKKIRNFLLHTKKPSVQDIANHVGVSRTTLYKDEYRQFIDEIYKGQYQKSLFEED